MFGLSKLGIGRKSSDTQTQPKEGDKKSSGSSSGKTSRHSHAAPSGMPPPRGQSGANASDQGARPRTRIGGESPSARPLSVREQRAQQFRAEVAAQGGVYAQGAYTPKPITEMPPASVSSPSPRTHGEDAFDPNSQAMMFNTPAEREFYQHIVNPGAQAQSGAAAETTPAAPERRTFGRSTQIQNTEYDASGRQAPSQRS